MTLLDILTSSLRAIGVKNPGVTLTADEVDDAKEILNLMLDLWSSEGLMVYATALEAFTLVVGQESYTIGSGGNFDTVRPSQVLDPAGFIRDSGGNDTRVDLIGFKEYQAIGDKETVGIPNSLHFEGTSPLGTIYIYPSPESALTLYLNSLKPLTAMDTLTATIELPPGYEAAIKSNLALDLCPEYQREPSQMLIKTAQESKKALINLNAANRLEPINLEYGDYKDYSQTIFNS